MHDITEEIRTQPAGLWFALLMVIPAILSCLFLAAYGFYTGGGGIAVSFIVAPLVLLSGQTWSRFVMMAVLVVGSIIWLSQILLIIVMRPEGGSEWVVATIIFITLASLSFFSALILLNWRVKAVINKGSLCSGLVAFAVTAAVYATLQNYIKSDFFIIEKMLRNGAWIEGYAISSLAATMAAGEFFNKVIASYDKPANG